MQDSERPGWLEARFLCPLCGVESRRNVFPHLERVLIHARCENSSCRAPVSFVLDLTAERQRALLRETPPESES